MIYLTLQERISAIEQIVITSGTTKPIDRDHHDAQAETTFKTRCLSIYGEGVPKHRQNCSALLKAPKRSKRVYGSRIKPGPLMTYRELERLFEA